MRPMLTSQRDTASSTGERTECPYNPRGEGSINALHADAAVHPVCSKARDRHPQGVATVLQNVVLWTKMAQQNGEVATCEMTTTFTQ